MKDRYVCVGCQGDTCSRCLGRGWVREFLVRLERTNMLVESVAKNLIQKKIAAVGPKRVGSAGGRGESTAEQFTELEVWQTTGPVKWQFMG